MAHTFEAEGIWGHILARAKPVEVSEIANIIGTKLLRDNSALWEELKAFNSILSDLATSDLLERVDDMIYHGGVPNSKDKVKHDVHDNAPAWGTLTADALQGQSRGAGVPSLDFTSSVLANSNSNPGRGSNNSSSRRGSQLSARSATSMDSLEFVQSIDAHISVLSIHAVAEQVRKALLSERAELESEIGVLRQAVDGETDIIASRSSSARLHVSSRGSTRGDDCSSGHHVGEDGKEKKSKISRFQSVESGYASRNRDSSRGEGKDASDLGSTSTDCAECRRINRDESVGKIRPNKLSASQSLSSLGMSRQEYVQGLATRYDESTQAARLDDRRACALRCADCAASQERRNKDASDKALAKSEHVGIAMRPGKSRVRKNLQAARDEKHFLDFDL